MIALKKAKMIAKILVIDDDPSIRYMIATFLSTKNYQVEVTSSVPQALELMTHYQPDVVCCDLMMPGLSGVDFLEYCYQSPELSSIPVIVISASGDEYLLGEARATGAFAHLPKPFSKVQLVNVIELALESVSG